MPICFLSVSLFAPVLSLKSHRGPLDTWARGMVPLVQVKGAGSQERSMSTDISRHSKEVVWQDDVSAAAQTIPHHLTSLS